jgi:predicted protein tyrosine phosphatase
MTCQIENSVNDALLDIRHTFSIPYNSKDRTITSVYPKLFVGSQGYDSHDLTWNQIKVIIQMNHKPLSQRMINTIKQQGIEIHRLFVADADDPKIVDILKQGYQIYKSASEQGKNVLIHCSGGISRSPTLAAYCMLKTVYTLGNPPSQKLILPEVFRAIKKVRPSVRPRSFFIKALLGEEWTMKKLQELL